MAHAWGFSMDEERKADDPDRATLAQAGTKSVEQQVKRARALVNSKGATGDGVRLLEDAARRGSDEAAYTLAWLHMQGTGVPRDNDKALDFLQTVRGDFRTSALILMSAVHAEGSKSKVPDKVRSQQLLDEAVAALEAELRHFQQHQPTDVEDVLRRQRWHENGSLLSGMAEKYGLIVTRPTKR